jgi:hypothetical protein
MPSEIVFFHALIYINLETLYGESQSECWKKCCRDYVLLSTYCLETRLSFWPLEPPVLAGAELVLSLPVEESDPNDATPDSFIFYVGTGWISLVICSNR